MFEKIYYRLVFPWFCARVYIAFQEYHERGCFKERVGAIGSLDAIKMFLDCLEYDLYYNRAIKRDSSLRWKMLFNPWQFEMPPLLETAGQAGI